MKDTKIQNAEGALAEIWGIVAPGCELEDYDGIVAYVARMQTALEHVKAVLGGE